MNLTVKQLSVTCVILLLTGAAIDRYFFAREIVKTEIKDRVITKYQVVTQVKEIVRPDGTKVIDTVTTDNSVRAENRESSVSVVKKAPDWIVSGGASFDRAYTAQVYRRILGPVFVGASADTSGRVFGLVSVEF